MAAAGRSDSSPDLDDENAARKFLERLRWPEGPVCPHCGSRGAYRLQAKPDSTNPVRNGVLKCRTCRRQFTVTVGTALEHSHIALSRWLMAIRRLCESETALSVYRLHQLVGVSRQSAWRMVQRVPLGDCAPPAARGAPAREPASLTGRPRFTQRSSAKPSVGALHPTTRSFYGTPFEEVLARMMNMRRADTVEVRARMKHGSGRERVPRV